jgi:rifampicin phosphotransferase
MQGQWVYFFGQGHADGGGDLKHLIGGKGASLADMTRAGLNVPPGFTLSAECCAHYYRSGNRWPDGLEAEVRANVDRLEKLTGRTFGVGDKPLLVAVRSGAERSMPGMMDTVLNVGLNSDCVRGLARRTGNPRGAWQAFYHFLLLFSRTVAGIDDAALDEVVRTFLDEMGKGGEDALDATQLEALCTRVATFYRARTGRDVPADPWAMLWAAIDAVFASWNSERAVAYRRHHKIEGLLGTAVNVQVMCPSEVSGVLFTANPVNPALKQIVLESSFGLGEAVVLGKVTPDRFVLDKENLTILERHISHKDKVVATLAESGAVQALAPDAASLTDAQVLELARLGLRVEAYFGYPCDLEWGLSAGQFYLLQARAIKQGAAPAPAIDAAQREQVRLEEIADLRARAEPGGTVWSRFNLYEILPEPTPMTWAIVKRFMSGQGGYGLMYRDLGFDPDPALDDAGVFDLVCGRPYCNLSLEPRMQYRTLPFEHSFEVLKKNPNKALYPQAVFNPAKAGWKFWLFLPFVFLKLVRSGTRLTAARRAFDATFEKQIVPPFLAQVELASQEDWSGKTDQELLAVLEHWTRFTLIDFARHSLKPTVFAALAMGNLERVLTRRLNPSGATTPTEDGQLPGMKQAQEALRKLVMGVRPPAETDLGGGIRALREGRLPMEEFLARFGHRGNQEMELAQARWAEDHADLDRMAGSGSAVKSATPQAAREVWEQVASAAKLAGHERTAVEAELQTLHRYLGLREAAKHYLLRGYVLIRRVLVELDRRHQLDGGIFFLLPEELPRLIAGDRGEREALVAASAIRKQRRAVALSLPVPQVIFSDNLEAIGRDVPAGSANLLQGVPLSAGTAEAIAWVLEQSANAEIPDEPYILVCPSTDPAWLPLFVHARGLVMETGGVLSHGAIVARDFGLPAVAGIADVHRRLKTGQRLRIDGGTGRVEVLA